MDSSNRSSIQQPKVVNNPEPWNTVITRRTTVYVSLVCFIAWVVSIYDFTLFGTLLPVIADDFGWTTAESTAVNTWATVGVFIVSLVVGAILDKFGRKRALILLVIGGAISSGLTGAAVGVASMVIIRSFSGFSLSEEVVNAVYLNEIYKKAKGRGFMFSLVQSGYPVGALLAAGLTVIFLPLVGWRGSFVIAAGISVIVVLLASRLPESPTFAAIKEVERRRKTGDTKGASQLAAEHEIQVGTGKKVGLRDVFTPELRRHTICLALAWLFSWMGTQVFSVLGTTVLVEAKGVSFDNALIILILSNAAAFVGYLFFGWVGDRLGRRNTVVIGFLLGGTASLLMLLGPDNSAFVITMYALTLFFELGAFAPLLFYMGESYPAQVRGTGTNLAHVMAPIGGLLGSGVLTVLLATDASMVTSALFAGSIPVVIAGVVMLGTRNVSHRSESEAMEGKA